jgi:hypothetical protein
MVVRVERANLGSSSAPNSSAISRPYTAHCLLPDRTRRLSLTLAAKRLLTLRLKIA